MINVITKSWFHRKPWNLKATERSWSWNYLIKLNSLRYTSLIQRRLFLSSVVTTHHVPMYASCLWNQLIVGLSLSDHLFHIKSPAFSLKFPVLGTNGCGLNWLSVEARFFLKNPLYVLSHITTVSTAVVLQFKLSQHKLPGFCHSHLRNK